MKSLVSAEAVDVVESRACRFVRQVQAYAPVKAKNEKLKVIAESDTCSHSELTEKVVEVESRTIEEVINLVNVELQVFKAPDISCIKKDSSMQVSEETLPVLEVGLELDIAVLQQEGVRLRRSTLSPC